MIKSLRVQNFQCHNKLFIEFDPTITTIVGSSDVGKSAIVRAMSWLAFNSPSGQAFVRQGSKGCTVALENDHHTVKRRRGKVVNCYEVNGKTLEALGKGAVPDDVLEALQLDDINFQYQHDSPLWLNISPGDVAKELNRIVNLDLIDRVLGRLTRQLKSTSTELTSCENRLLKANSDTKKLQWIEEADKEYKEIEDLQASLSIVQTEHTQLLALVVLIQHSQDKVSSLKEAIGPMKQELMEIQKLKQQADEAGVKSDKLFVLLREIKTKSNELQMLEKERNEAREELDLVKVCPVCQRPLK